MVDNDETKTKNSNHILPKITYARDLVRGDIARIEYLNTNDMTADMLTKPLHGEPFRRHRNTLLGQHTTNDYRYHGPRDQRK